MISNKTIGVLSLGCDKNRVDTEKMLSILSESFKLTNDEETADVIIINTCAFLESSRREAIQEILFATSLKKEGKVEKVIVTGCLPQLLIKEIYDELYDVDAFLGISDYQKLPEVIERIYKGERVNFVGEPRNECQKSRVLTTDNYAYLKIADGCSNHCTYCLIPRIRGGYRSIPIQELVEEVKGLGDLKELILVAQDVTKYGYDLTPKSSLPELIRSLSALNNVRGIRLLYCYPENVTDELIHEFQCNAKMIRYIDIPFQHADDRVLKLMNRKGTGEGYLALIEKLKREIQGIAIRSTFITGFPGETEEAFEKLIEFLQKAKLFNAGFFKYSREEGTASYNLPDQVPERVKTLRHKKLYSVQKKIVKENYKRLKGQIFSVLCEGFDENMLTYYGRAYFNAPDVDGKIYFFSSEESICGENYNVRIIKSDGYDLYGERI